MEEIKDVFAGNLIRLRTNAGLTQAQLAGKLGIKAPTMNQKLNNVRPMFLHEADIVAKELGIGPELFCAYFFWNEIA